MGLPLTSPQVINLLELAPSPSDCRPWGVAGVSSGQFPPPLLMCAVYVGRNITAAAGIGHESRSRSRSLATLMPASDAMEETDAEPSEAETPAHLSRPGAGRRLAVAAG